MTYRWLLPEFIEDLLPPDAWRLESARRELLDLFRAQGFQLVMPPLLEYIESLQASTGRDMDLLTFRLVDQLSGRQLGLRADTTLQVARIDAHGMNHQGVNRLCYAGSILHARPEGLNQSREPFQVGAEIYGLGGLEGDIEIQELMLEALKRTGLPKVTLDVGHVGLFRTLSRLAGLDDKAEGEWFEALQNKDLPALQALSSALGTPQGDALAQLARLNGDREVLNQAHRLLPQVPEIRQALSELEAVAAHFGQRVPLAFDLAELRGYHYHSGLVFAAYAEGYPDAVARGGRYDDIGRAFGRARPATGFSLDLRELLPSLPPS
ncbi:MAG: ATP phosphoribosyltransferase regulatory subunit [Betaproteobacteria bacterium]|nr:ATP phosphoribosyltransferase regulatory subunit [Betaproteobacteria bacterium]